MARFMMISGAWHAGWCWALVKPILEARGHCVIAPDLPGTGDDVIDARLVSRSLWAAFVGDLIRKEPEPIVLIGHSRGGLTISDAAGPVADRISCMVYLTAMVLPPGVPLQTVAGIMVDHPHEQIACQPASDGAAFVLAEEQIERLFYNCTPAELVARAAASFTPEPMGGSSGIMDADERLLAIPKIYVECLRDRAVPVSVQRRLQALMPFDHVLSIDTDHSPFFSAPHALAGILEEVGCRYYK